MRTLILAVAMLGAIAAAPVRAAPTLQPATTAFASFDQSAVRPVQYAYSRREIRRREALRRRQEYYRRHHH